MASETMDMLANDQRVSLRDSLLLYHVPVPPDFLQKVAILKPSGMTIQCYFYIMGKDNFQTGNTSYIDYHEMAGTLQTLYATVRRCINWLVKYGFIIRLDKRYGNRFHIPECLNVKADTDRLR